MTIYEITDFYQLSYSVLFIYVTFLEHLGINSDSCVWVVEMSIDDRVHVEFSTKYYVHLRRLQNT